MRVMKDNEQDSSPGREALFCEYLNHTLEIVIHLREHGAIVENRLGPLFVFSKRKKKI